MIYPKWPNSTRKLVVEGGVQKNWIANELFCAQFSLKMSQECETALTSWCSGNFTSPTLDLLNFPLGLSPLVRSWVQCCLFAAPRSDQM